VRAPGLACITALALVVCGVWPGGVHATSVVAVQGYGEVVLAVDSKTLHTGWTRRETIGCKLRQVPGGFFALGGVNRADGGEFDFGRIASAAGEVRGDLDAKAARFQALAREPFRRYYDLAKQQLPVDDAVLRDFNVHTVMMGLRGGRPSLIWVGHRVRGGRVEPLGPRLYPDGWIRRTDEAWAAYLLTAPANWPTQPIEAIARSLIEIEARQRSALVSGPFSILKVDAAGAAWVDRGLCPPLDVKLWSRY
jgi:hypothetical protein